jgi:hypothetical protein
VLLWLHKAPIIGPLFSESVNLTHSQIDVFLSTYADREFNNPSGLYGVVYDLGLPLGFTYLALAGFLAGVAYSAFRARRAAGILFYPMFFLFFLEIFRFSYFGVSRSVLWLFGILLALTVIGIADSPSPLRRWSVASKVSPGAYSRPS